MSSSLPKINFQDYRLSMTTGERFLFRVISFSTYSIVIATTATFLLSGLKQLEWAGFGLFLFLADRYWHRHLGYYSIHPAPKKVNSANYFTSPAYHFLEKSLDKTRLNSGHLPLHLFDVLMERKEISAIISRLNIKPSELIQTIHEQIDKSKTNPPPTGGPKPLTLVRDISNLAYQSAYLENKPAITPYHLFLSLFSQSDPYIKKITTLFPVSPQNFLITTHLQLEKLSDHYSTTKDIRLIFTDSVVNKIGQLVYQPSATALPLSKTISQYIKQPLDLEVLDNKVKKGDAIEVTYKDNQFLFRHK